MDYVAGLAMSYNQQTIMEMLSFYDKSKNVNSVTETKTVDPTGYTVFKKTETKIKFWKKDLFALFGMQDEWTNLFWSQRLLQMIQPYVFIAMLETTVGIVFSFMFYFAYL